MAPNKISTLVLASVVVIAAGCSGGRLRNLISRNDYQTLEELNAADEKIAGQSREAIAGTNRDPSRLASEQHVVGETEERDRRFSLTRLFSPKSEEPSYADDPFAEPMGATVSKDVTGSGVKTVSAMGDSFPLKDRTVETASSSVENTKQDALDLMAELLDSDEPDRTNPFAEAIAKTAAEVEPATETALSFQEIMARRASRSTSEAESSTFQPPAAKVAESLVDFNANSSVSEPGSGFEFDSLINEDDVRLAESTPETDSSFDFDPADAEQSFDQAIAKSAIAAAQSAPAAEQDQYAMASQKHGFKPLGKPNPWAAFDNQPATTWDNDTEEDTQPAGDFAWGEPTTNDFDRDVNLGTEEFSDQRFMQVASTSTVDQNLTVDASQDESGLVIPFNNRTAETVTNFEEVTIDAELMDDPFFAATDSPEFSEPSATNVANAEAEPVIGGPAAILGWPIRTWFFALGCAILLILLFLPNRQNQSN